MFRHLNQNAKTCLSPEEYEDFLVNVLSNKREKIGVLYGYFPGTDYKFLDRHHHPPSSRDASSLIGIQGGRHAAWLLTQAIDRVSRVLDCDLDDAMENLPHLSAYEAANSKINRSYGSTSRESESVAQDPHTGAITEARMPCLCSLMTIPMTIPGVTHERKSRKRRWLGYHP